MKLKWLFLLTFLIALSFFAFDQISKKPFDHTPNQPTANSSDKGTTVSTPKPKDLRPVNKEQITKIYTNTDPQSTSTIFSATPSSYESVYNNPEEEASLKELVLVNETEESKLPLKVINYDWQDIPCQEVQYCHVKDGYSDKQIYNYLAQALQNKHLMKDAIQKNGQFCLPDIKKGLYYIIIKAENYPLQYKQVLKHDDKFFLQLDPGKTYSVNFKGSINNLTSLDYQIRATKDQYDHFAAPMLRSSGKTNNKHYLPEGNKSIIFPQIFSIWNNYQFDNTNTIEIDLSKLSLFTLHLDENKAEILKKINLSPKDFENKNSYSFLYETTTCLKNITNFFSKLDFKVYFKSESNEFILKKPMLKKIKISVFDQHSNNITNLLRLSANCKKTQKDDLRADKIDGYDEHGYFSPSQYSQSTTSDFAVITLTEAQLKTGKVFMSYFIDKNITITTEHAINEKSEHLNDTINIPQKFYTTGTLKNLPKDISRDQIGAFVNGFRITPRFLSPTNLDQIILINPVKLKSSSEKYESFEDLEIDGTQDAYERLPLDKWDNIYVDNDESGEYLYIQVANHENFYQKISDENIPFEHTFKKSQIYYGLLLNKSKQPIKNQPIKIKWYAYGEFYKTITTDANGRFSFTAPSIHAIFEIDDIYSFKIDDIYLSTPEKPTIIYDQNIEKTNYSVKSMNNKPVKNAIILLDSPKDKPNFDTYKERYQVMYTDQNGQPYTKNTNNWVTCIFHPNEGSLNRLSSCSDTFEVTLDPFLKNKTAIKHLSVKNKLNNTIYQANATPLITLYATQTSFENISHFDDITPITDKEIGFYYYQDDDGKHTLVTIQPFINKKVIFPAAKQGDLIEITLTIDEHKFLNETIEIVDRKEYFFSDIFKPGYQKTKNKIDSMFLNFKNNNKSKTIALDINNIPSSITVEIEEEENLIYLKNLKENHQNQTKFFGKKANEDNFTPLSFKKESINGSNEIEAYYLASQSWDFSGKLIIANPYSNLIQTDYIKGAQKNISFDSIEGGKVTIKKHYDDRSTLTMTYQSAPLASLFECEISIDNDTTKTTLSEGIWSYHWFGTEHIVEVNKSKDLIIELLGPSNKLKYALKINNTRVPFDHETIEFNTNRWISLNEKDLSYNLNYKWNWEIELRKNNNNIERVIPINTNNIEKDFEIDLDKEIITTTSWLYYKFTDKQNIANRTFATEFNLSMLNTLQPLYTSNSQNKNEIEEIRKYTNKQDLINTYKDIATNSIEIKINKNDLKITNLYIITNESYLIKLANENNNDFHFKIPNDDPYHIYCNTADGPIFIKNIASSLTKLNTKDIRKNKTFEVNMTTEKGIISIFSEDTNTTLPIHIDILLGSYSQTYDMFHYFLNEGEQVRFKCKQVPYGKYHFTLYNPNTEALTKSATFEVNETTTKIDLEIK